MTRGYILVSIFFLISIVASGQCLNSPTLTLSSTIGSICTITAVTVSGNTFGGSATKVTITEDGAGSVSPASATKSPFSFTYTPKSGDSGKKVTITVTTDNPLGLPCSAAKATYTLTVNTNPSVPVVGTITKPTCSVATGSVVLSGLPSSGTWTLTRTPGGITTSGTGTTTTISGLAAGTYTFIVTNSTGCTSSASSNVIIPAQPESPARPVQSVDCALGSGKAVVKITSPTGTGLTFSLDGGTYQSGSSFSNVADGNHSVTVKSPSACTTTGDIFRVSCGCVNPPTPPIVGVISQPTCSLSTGSVVLNGLPGTGTWILTRYPGTLISTGSGTSITLSGLSGGIYNFTVTNASGCVSSMSANVIIPDQPLTPSPPEIGNITQPVSELPTGSVVLNGLPESGSWTLTLTPGNKIYSGTGITKTISDLAPGIYNFTVTNQAGCTSGLSASFGILPLSHTPLVVITDPAPVCFPSTVDLTDPKLTTGSDLNLIYSYWTDASATIQYKTPAAANAGTYFIKGSTTDGLFSVKPITVISFQIPLANAGTDQVLTYQFETKLDAELASKYETGVWSVISGTGEFFDSTYAKTNIDGLSIGKNILKWTVKNGVCSSSSDTVMIQVNDIVISTLITPNMDGKNDYLVIKGSEDLGKMELIIFDRRGIQVYKTGNYDNLWNGVDYNGNPLPDDTYFYVIKTETGRSVSGYVVIRR